MARRDIASSTRGRFWFLFKLTQAFTGEPSIWVLNGHGFGLVLAVVTKTSSRFQDFVTHFVTPPGPMDKGIVPMCDVCDEVFAFKNTSTRARRVQAWAR